MVSNISTPPPPPHISRETNAYLMGSNDVSVSFSSFTDPESGMRYYDVHLLLLSTGVSVWSSTVTVTSPSATNDVLVSMVGNAAAITTSEAYQWVVTGYNGARCHTTIRSARFIVDAAPPLVDPAGAVATYLGPSPLAHANDFAVLLLQLTSLPCLHTLFPRLSS